MGNTAGKEVRTRSNFENIVGDESFGPSDASLLSTGAFAREFLGYDINSNNLLNGSNGRDNSGFFNKKKKEKEMEKLKFKTMQIFNLVIKYEENVDGGYLAPYANYKYNLDYATNIVKGLITSRNLSPFFTPLEEFDESWTDEELLSYLYENLKLHEDIKPNDLIDDFEDPNDHRLTQSANVIKRQENKLFKQRLKERAAELQNLENVRFLKEFKASRSDMGKKYEDIPNDDLLLRVYRNSEECPICFLYYPNMLNVTKCCNQRICTECFVQMKRLEPHFPHDENGEIGTDVTPVDDETDSRPENLISEPVKCPFCANEEFGISYTPPKDFKTGLKSDCKASAYENGDKNTVEDEVTEIDLEDPFSQKTANSSAKANKKTFDNTNGNRESKDQSPMIITIDTIRPDWEQKLLSARTKMARRSAAATALHASSLLSNDTDVEHSRSRRRRSTANSHHRHHNHERRDSGRIVSRQDQDELEQRMIEEAMRLSLLDEEERKMKERIKGKK